MKRLLVRIVLGGLLLLALVSCAAILLTQRDPRDLLPPKSSWAIVRNTIPPSR